MTEAERIRRQALRRLDDALRRIPVVDKSPVACEAGCHYCCHLRVMVTPVEVFGLLDFMQARFTEEEFGEFRQRLRKSAERVRLVPGDRLLSVNIPCPVLVNGQCSAYAARPFNCRSYHSLDRDACQRSFENPERPGQGHPQFSKVARVHESCQAGLLKQTAEAGYDSRQYELVTALEEALDDLEARRRFEVKEPEVFRRAVEVIL